MKRTTTGKNRSALIALFVGALIGAAGPNSARAVLIAYEPFRYNDVNGPVLGKNGGIGWTGAWASPRPSDGAGATPNGSNSIQAGSLIGPAGLPTLGNHALFTGEFGTMEGMYRPFTNVAGTAGTSTWFSFLGQRLGETSTNVAGNLYPRGANVGLFDTQATAQGPNNFERVAVGNSSNANSDAWSIVPQGSGTLREGGDDPWSTLSWGVLRIDHIGDHTVADSAWLWINPNPLGGEPLTANADVEILSGDTNSRDFSNIDFLRPFVGNVQGTVGNANHRPFAVMAVDEIRLGTAWDDMRATPEPASAVLLAVAGIGLLARRWR